MSRPTIYDVAALAGVGVKTVSRYLNGVRVRPATTKAIRKAVEQLGYRRNDGAAMLRRGTTASIGLVVDDISEPFQSVLARAVEAVTIREGSVLMTASSENDPERERLVIETFLSRRVDGLIVMPVGERYEYLLRDIRAGLAVVFVDRPASDLEVDTVLADNFGGMLGAVRHLIEHGHTRIGYFGDRPSSYTALERLRGYREALRGAGIDDDEALVDMRSVDDQSVLSSLRRMLSLPSPATAFATANGPLTFSLLLGVQQLQSSPAIVGFDDFPLASLLHPPVTVVRQDIVSMGRTAADLLFRRVGGDAGAIQRIHLTTELIERGSGEMPPTPRSTLTRASS